MYQYLHPSTDAQGRRLPQTPETRSQSQSVDRAKSILDLAGTVWFIIGNWWMFSSDTCASTNAMMYYLSITIIAFGYFVLAIPLLFCGAVIFCLPCVLAVLRILRVGQMNPNAGQGENHGLPDEIIGKIPVYFFKRKASTLDNNVAGTAEPKIQGPPIVEEPEPTAKPSLLQFLSRGRRNSAAQSSEEGQLPLELEEEDAVCVICLGSYEEGEELRQLACQHHFHKTCIDEWLHVQKTCPLCVQEVGGEPGPSVPVDV